MKLIICIFIVFMFCSCNLNPEDEYCSISNEIITVEFSKPFNFKGKDIYIDNLRFQHSKNKDTAFFPQYLPDQELIVLEVQEKQAIIKSNEISLGIELSKRLIRTKRYQILNKSQVMTQGIVKFKRIDGKKILVKLNKLYPARINNLRCKD